MSGVEVVGRYVSRTWSSGSARQDPSHTTTQQQPPPPPPQTPSSRQPSSPWRIPAFFRRKFEIAQRGGGRVRSSGDPEGGNGEAFKDPPSSLKDPLKDPMIRPSTSREPIREPITLDPTTPSSYTEPEIIDAGSPEPRYLDLFDPSVSVVRDPKLDIPPPPLSKRAHTALHSCLSTLASTRVIIGCSILVIVLVVVIVTLATTSHRGLFLPDPRVQPPHVTTVTTCGIIQGKIEDETFVFRGVPYAVPPLGELRFRPARLHTSLHDCWTGTYVADKVQPCWTYDSQGGVVSGWEDCLLLDIFTPQLGYDTPLPVVVYIGGAGLGQDGERTWMLGRARQVVKDRRVVIVSPQVRRGPLGFLPHSALAATTYPHTSGNQGGSDLFAALVWTKRNIEHFGGAPGEIIVLGHQGGAGLSWPVLSAPRTHSLVRAAWLSGAAPRHPNIPWRQADQGLVSHLNCSSVFCLQTVEAEAIMEAVDPARRTDITEPWLVADGVIIPFLPTPPPITLMIGSSRQGASHRLLSWRDRVSSSQQNLIDAIMESLLSDKSKEELNQDRESSGRVRWPLPPVWKEPDKIIFTAKQAEAAQQWYSDLKDDPWQLLTTLVSDATINCPALNTAAKIARDRSSALPNSDDIPVYSYISNHRRLSRAGQIADGSSDIEAIMGVFEAKNDADAKYAKAMQDLFFLFVHAGAPERHEPRSAHLGVYAVDKEVTIMRSLVACPHWVNMSHLATRF